MFKKQETKKALPSVADLQAIAQMPAKAWGMARIALIVWAVFWGIGITVRLFSSFKMLRMSRKESDLPEAAEPRPVYALLNFNIYGKKVEKAAD